ncbi:Drug/metabolite transporter domain containing protein [Pseudohyphozyma bogoriensis]|nr:Drug/metabolite transporter domain containing protein [Pseudohyphozyma bogoriensis]
MSAPMAKSDAALSSLPEVGVEVLAKTEVPAVEAFTVRDYDNEDDEEAGNYGARPSTSRLLADEDDEMAAASPVTPSAAARQERLRDYRLDLEEEDEKSGVVARGKARAKVFWKRNEGFLLIAVSQFFFSASSVFVKIWELIVIRMGFTGLGAYIYLRRSGIEYPLTAPPGVRLLLVGRGIGGLFGISGFYISLRYLSLPDAVVISFLSPVAVGLLAIVVLKEVYSRVEGVSAILSFFGVFLIAKPTFLFPDHVDDTQVGGVPVAPAQRAWAVTAGLAAVVGAGCAYVVIRKVGERANTFHSVVYYCAISVGMSLTYPCVATSPPVSIWDKDVLGLLVAVCFFGGAGLALLTMGLRVGKAGKSTLAIYTDLLYALIFEKVIFGKDVDGWSLAGGFIIVGGALAVVWDKEQPKAVKKAPTENVV